MSKYNAQSPILPQDPPKLREQIEVLERRGYPVMRCTRYHIKIGDYNWFWSTGKITIDPQTRHPEKGFDAFLRLLPDPMKKGGRVTISLRPMSE